MYGCGDAALVKKRTNRNPFKRTIPYELACPEMKDLLHWCGPELFDVSQVPWKLPTSFSSSSSSSFTASKNQDNFATKNKQPKTQPNDDKVAKSVGGSKLKGGSTLNNGEVTTKAASVVGGGMSSSLDKKREYDRKRQKAST